MNFVDVSYHYSPVSQPERLLHDHKPNLGYLHHLPHDWKCALIKFLDAEGHIPQERFNYYFFKGKASRLWVPLMADWFIKRLNPGLVMTHGLIFPHQVMLLKRQLPAGAKLIIQHHAEKPGKGMMRRLQKLANKYVDGYLFTTRQLAEPWVQQGIIQQEKVFEVMEGSSVMERMDKQAARQQLGLGSGPVFLWVGRLDANKDPITVLHAFTQYLTNHPTAKLYMVYQDDELLPAIKQALSAGAALREAVVLIGKVERSQLASWYSAADYYISGSHSEGSGYALIEAMSCGCIPVVTDIPSFRKITKNGDAGLLFRPGDAASLLHTLERLDDLSKEQLIAKVLSQFESELSFKAIARQLTEVYATLLHK